MEAIELLQGYKRMYKFRNIYKTQSLWEIHHSGKPTITGKERKLH